MWCGRMEPVPDRGETDFIVQCGQDFKKIKKWPKKRR